MKLASLKASRPAGTAGWEGRSPDGIVRLVAAPGARFADTPEEG
ncbi:hypothetical protein [Zoogloea sp.]|jgi:hypothetical protein|nr:hypothetical protein [Zoogloea sp.]